VRRGCAARLSTRGPTRGRASTAALVSGAGTTSVRGSVFVVVVIAIVFFDSAAGGTSTNGKSAGDICAGRGSRDAHRTRRAADRGANGHRRGQCTMGCIEASLNKILALGLCYKRL